MGQTRERRSPRLAVQLPIRVYAIDFKGTDFVEDATTLVVKQHGAKISLLRQLIPEQEIQILCQPTNQEAVFRVVSKLTKQPQGQNTFWGVECADPEGNIWGIGFPALGPQDQSCARVMLQCPECQVQEMLFINERLLEGMQANGGLQRECASCGKSGLWKQLPYSES